MKRAVFFVAMLSAGFAFAHGGGGGGCCGGHGGGCGGDDGSIAFALPEVRQTVKFDGLSLDVDRTKWSIFTSRKPGLPGSFASPDTSVRVFAVPDSKDLSKQALAMGVPADVTVKVMPFMTDYGISGVLATYGTPPGFFNSNIHTMRYLLRNPKGGVLCFEVTPLKKFPDWRDSQALLNTLSPVWSAG